MCLSGQHQLKFISVAVRRTEDEVKLRSQTREDSSKHRAIANAKMINSMIKLFYWKLRSERTVESLEGIEDTQTPRMFFFFFYLSVKNLQLCVVHSLLKNTMDQIPTDKNYIEHITITMHILAMFLSKKRTV